jgi:hypothetical protein
MRKKTNGTGLLVVMELGASFPEAISNVRTGPLLGSGARRVVAQEEGESPAAFSQRVAEGLEALFGRAVKLSNVAIACNERADEAAQAARRQLAERALGLMASNGGGDGSLYLTAAERSSGRVRHALSALAQDLAQEWRSAGLSATVDFGERRASSPAAHSAVA